MCVCVCVCVCVHACVHVFMSLMKAHVILTSLSTLCEVAASTYSYIIDSIKSYILLQVLV